MIVRAGVGETLTKLDSSMSTVGWLATDDYAVSEDGLTWTFTIRDDVCFSNGTKLTAELAMASIQYDFDNSTRALDFVSLDSIQFLQFMDTSTMNLCFLSGELDVCYGLSTTDIVTYLDNDAYTVEQCTSLRTDWGLMNQNGLLSDKALRIALLECLDMETICEALQYAAGTLGISIHINYVQDLWSGTIQNGIYDLCVFNSSVFHSADVAME